MTENPRKILVTGGSGFIGTHLINQLVTSGYNCVNYDKKPPGLEAHGRYWVQGDILDYSKLAAKMNEFQPNYVVHLAARTDLDGKTIEAYRENTDGTRMVLESASESGSVRRVVVASTMYVCRRGFVSQSDREYATDTVYGESKVQMEEVVRSGQWPFEWSIVRPAVIWGPFHDRLRQEFFRILSMGIYFHPGRTRTLRSYGYVENTAWQIVRILEAESSQVSARTFYLADPPVDVCEWVTECSQQLRGRGVHSIPMPLLKGVALFGDVAKKIGVRKFPLTSFRLANMTKDWTVDTAPIEMVAGLVPTSMKEGVRRTVEWLRSHE